LFVGGYPAVESNSVLEAIFSIPEYKKLYDGGELQDSGFVRIDTIEDLEVTLSTGKKEVLEKVYFVKSNIYVPTVGLTTKIYSK
jgi:hypothetical protein